MSEYSSAKTLVFSTTIVTKRDDHKRERDGFILESVRGRRPREAVKEA